jgi:ferritin
MKLTTNVQDVLNKQINTEFWSAYMYLSMSVWCESEGLGGFANWLKVQYHEENGHALKLIKYIQERQGSIELKPLKEVPVKWSSVLEVMKHTYEHECKVTELIYNCVNVAEAEKDRASVSMLQWFVNEQVEEEASTIDLVNKLQMIGDNKGALYQLDGYLRMRKSE